MTAVRLQATRILTKLLRREGSLSTLLPTAVVETDPRDQNLLQALCYGTCRWQPRLNCYLLELLEKPLRNKDTDIRALLLLGLYQLCETRIPAHAAISETVEVASQLKKPWAKALVNGVLRRFQRERQQLDQRLQDQRSFRTAHPDWLAQAIELAWPLNSDAIFASNNSHPPFTLRVNRREQSRENYLQQLQALDLDARETPFSPDGITLARPCGVDELPGFQKGTCSVQDEAAQLAAHLLAVEPEMQVLDACCAPGGKTAHLLELQPNIHCLGIDISEERIALSKHTLQRLHLSAQLKVADATLPSQWWDGHLFDRILIDAPCSATGIVRRHPDIKILREADNIAKLANMQVSLLQALWPLLKVDGLMLYATCSILPEENTQVIEGFMQNRDDMEHVTIAADWGIVQRKGRQMLPQEEGHDGFFYALLRKLR